LIPVSLFFLISGFVILLTLQRTRHSMDFVVSRFSRLFPVYWVAVILTFTVMTLAPVPGRETTLWQAIVNLTMLQPWLRVPYVDGVYWTLSVELSFYAMMLLLFRLDWLRRLELIAFPWMAAECGWHILAQYRSVSWIIEISLLLKFAHLFIAGMVFYRAKTGGWTPLRGLVLLVSLATQFFVHGPVSAAFLAAFFVAFAALAADRLSFIAVRPLVFLGSISYSLYLIHQNIGYAILAHSGLPHFWGVAVAVLVVVSLATALTYLIERPCQQAIRRLYTRPSDSTPRIVPRAQGDLA
jgi:peptidoglycan/LPS O-acetylase OafA/YrhL